MNDQNISCPYCNALIPAPADGAQRRPACPRCGELLPARLVPAARTDISPRPASRPLDYPPLPELTVGGGAESIRRVRGIVLGIMGAMAILGIAFAWSTVGWRRQHDPRPPRSSIIQPSRPGSPAAKGTTPIPPYQLAALGWLPPQTCMVIAVRVADAELQPAGREMLERLKLPLLPISPADLAPWTGLNQNEIDHAVLGIKRDGGIVPMLLVVKSRQPINLDRIRKVLKAERSTELNSKRTVWHFTPRTSFKPSFDAMLWHASADTLIVSLTRADIDAMPDRPQPEGNQLAKPLQEILRTRVPTGSQAWLAGHVEKWDGVAPLLALLMPKDDYQTLTLMRSFSFSFHCRNDVRLTGSVRGGDEMLTREIGEKWSTWKPLDGNPAFKGLMPLLQDFTDSYHREVRDGWLEIRAMGKTAAKSE